MLDTRSGQLLTTKSFQERFSELQFASGGLSYLLHKSGDSSHEEIELHHLDLSTNTSSLVTLFTHYPQPKIRPSQWRGSLSPDSSLLVYQQDVLQPIITVANGKDGRRISQIRWVEDLTALPVHIDPHNELIVVPLAVWDGQYQYGVTRMLLLANLKTGEVLGKYDVAEPVSHVLFQEKGIVLIDNANHVGHLSVGSPSITWKPGEAATQQGRQHVYYSNTKGAGFYSKTNNEDTGEFRLLKDDAWTPAFTLEKGYQPVGLRGDLLVSEKYTPRELPGWLHKINEQCSSLLGRYLVSPMVYALRYQDATTGKLLTEHRFEQRKGNEYVMHRTSGSTRLATVSLEQDHLSVEFVDVFPCWTTRTIALLALVLTLLFSRVPGVMHQATNGNRVLGSTHRPLSL